MALAHRLACALIFYQTNDGELPKSINALREDLKQTPPSGRPANFDQLCTLVDQTEGVHFRDLFSRLPTRAASGDEALQQVLNLVG